MRDIRQFLLLGFFTMMSFAASAQDETTLAMTNEQEANHQVKRFSNSESPNISFIIETKMEDCTVEIKTNYNSPYKIRFIDYWGKSVRVYRNIESNRKLDVSEFKEQIMIMNITDHNSNKLLTSQVVNLKRRNYHD